MSDTKMTYHDPEIGIRRLKIIATAVILLALIGLAAAVTFTILDLIPFHHLFGNCSCGLILPLG